ncbi:hypothetical protein LCGC14_1347800 [marine sediment metagenome]|uniref:Uncharacterized protein n=1 Tax=marine sediment metagenome TaxID=412755 RepID=A0A0F9KXU9_9ZZZZ
MKYDAHMIRHLHMATLFRANGVLQVLEVPDGYQADDILIDRDKLHIAIDNLESVLSEIRRLK